MINLNDYVNNLHVSLDEVDESLKDKINNLEGYVINECCGCCCGCACDEKYQMLKQLPLEICLVDLILYKI